jgi:opacity protein-like surface antigen
MKRFLASAALLTLLATPALAQSPSPQSQSSPQASANSGQGLAAAQKIKQDLQTAGFTDVKVVAESFVVQAKSKNGDPVLMTIGPHGMSIFEAMNGDNSSKSGSGSTTGSSGNSSTNSTSPAPQK